MKRLFILTTLLLTLLSGLAMMTQWQPAQAKVLESSVTIPRHGTTMQAVANIQVKPNTPPTATVTISPTTPLDDDNLTLNYHYFDADGDAEELAKLQRFWYLNGQLQPAFTSITVPFQATAPQETWCATVRVYDGIEYGPVAPLACVTIGTGKNHAPQVLSATMMVVRQVAGSILRVTGIYSDVDLPCPNCGKKVESLPQTRILWFRDDVLQPEFNNLAELPRSVTIAGEVWHVTLQVFDGIDTSGIVKTLPVMIVTSMGNTPPKAIVRIVPIDSSNGRVLPGAPVDNNNLRVEYDFFDADGQVEQGSLIYWYNPLTQTKYNDQVTIPASETQVGQVWYVRVIPCDGRDCGLAVDSDSVQILSNPYNNPPIVEGLRLLPLVPYITDSINLQYVFKDSDGDIELGTQIRWTNNGKEESLLDDITKVPSLMLNLGDTWCVTVLPKDGRGALGKLYGPACVTIGASFINDVPKVEQVYISPINLPNNQFRKPTNNENLELRYTFIDDNCIPSHYKNCEYDSEIRWYKDGSPQTAFDDLTVVSDTATLPGEKWYATIRPHDGLAFGQMVTAPETVINHPPALLAVTFIPLSPTVATAFTTTCVYTDADGDPPSFFSYRWSRNGIPIAIYNDKASLPAQTTKEGETWTVTCTAHDGIEAGNTLSETVSFNTPTPIPCTLNKRAIPR